MNLVDAKYKDFALVQEMLETPDIMARFDYGQTAAVAEEVKKRGKLFLTGEGSSRIFPAKNMITEVLRAGSPFMVATEGARQAHEYALDDFVVFGASNSGQTKEVISLFHRLREKGHSARYGLTAHDGTKLADLSNECFVLTCGKEDAVAATKSVVEQGLFYQSLLCAVTDAGSPHVANNQQQAADAGRQALEMEIPSEIVQAVAAAPVIHFAGRNNGVAEELTLKTNEITRRKSDYLEGTYAVHGIEEVMNPGEVVVIVDPYPEEVEKFRDCLEKGVGMYVVAIASQPTLFPTIEIPHVWGYDSFLQLMAGWNLLVSVGIANGIDLDKPERARKVGNAFEG